jgi:RNA polymerase sigma-70 factor (ECF subfamily)
MDDRRCDNLEQELLQGREPSALMEAVAACLGEEIRRFAEARCGSRRGDLEDISQDVLLAAHRYLGSFRGEASLRSWLFRLVLSACSRRRRGRKNDPALHRPLEEEGGEAGASEVANPEMVLMISERLSALQAAMAELRSEDQELLREVEWEGSSLEEVGRRHGLTVPAMKSRMFRIRRQLKHLVSRKFAAGQQRAAAERPPASEP